MRKFLCKLGWHKWTTLFFFDNRQCVYCQKRQYWISYGHPNDKVFGSWRDN